MSESSVVELFAEIVDLKDENDRLHRELAKARAALAETQAWLKTHEGRTVRVERVNVGRTIVVPDALPFAECVRRLTIEYA